MFKSFLRYKYKTALILLSTVAAIASIFLITALGNGIVSMYASMLKTDGDIIVTQKGVADTFFSDVNLSLLPKIAAIDGVASAQGVIVGAGALGEISIAGIYGVTENRMHNYRLAHGRYPEGKEAILGERIAKILHDPKTVELMGKPFRVSGVFHSDIGFENGGVVVPIAQAQTLFGKSASFLLVSIDDFDRNSKEIIDRIRTLDSDIDVKSTNAFIDNYNQFKIIRISSGVIASVSFLMGFLSIVSLMSMMINDRRYEFGIKRALGISKARIVLEVILEVATLTLTAFVIAFFLSLALLYLLEHIDRFQGYLSGKIDAVLFAQLFVGSMAMAVAGAAIPAWLAARIDPIILINEGR